MRRTSTPLKTAAPAWERTGIERLYKRVGKRKISWIYKHLDGRSETLASSPIGGGSERTDAERLAKRLAIEMQQGAVIAGSVAEMIERFELDVAPKHYADQSKHGRDNRKAVYKNLTAFFGAMSPGSLRTQHGYQYLEARAEAGAPIRANKEISQMSTICHFGVRWGLMETNPFVDMMMNQGERSVRAITRSQVVRFYLWSLKQRQGYRTFGCAALFAYLTGFRASEVRPFLESGITSEGVRVVSAKRKKGEAIVHKLRDWSPRLRCVVARARDRKESVPSVYLFASTRKGACYSRSGWTSSWQDAMHDWIRSFDPTLKGPGPDTTAHPMYFSLQDIRPAAITSKLANRSADAYDFAAHASPSTTHKFYDRRGVKRASATE